MIGLLKSLYKNESGGFAILFAFVLTLLIGITGAAIDYARANLLRSELVSALDAAALAAGASANSGDVEAVAQRYFNVNYPQGYLGSSVGPVTFQGADDQVVLSVAATLDYSLLGIFNDGLINVAATTEVTIEKRGMELVLVMDNTGSMFVNDQIGTMKAAAVNLIDIISVSYTHLTLPTKRIV